MYLLALKMLLADRAKYVMLISGLTFATLLMTQQAGVFCGIMLWTTSQLRNTRAEIWVVDPKVEQVAEAKPMRDTDLGRVRSVMGVEWAMPMSSTQVQAKLQNGTFKNINLTGVDSTTLMGIPSTLTAGSFEGLRKPKGVLIDQVGVERLSVGRDRPLGVGDTFEINDHEVEVVGLIHAARSFTGMPYVYTTYDKAVEFAPKTRKTVTYIIVKPQAGLEAGAVARAIEQETGLRAYTENEFFWSTIWWYIKNTGIPISFGSTIILGVVVGIAISGQTFYSFVLENMRNLGALKAMGVTDGVLARMLMLQALMVGFIGYGMGIGLTSFIGFMFQRKEQPPFFMPYQLPLATLTMILLICIFAALLGIRKVVKLEPAIVFRG